MRQFFPKAVSYSIFVEWGKVTTRQRYHQESTFEQTYGHQLR